MKSSFCYSVVVIFALLGSYSLLCSCNKGQEHIAPAIHQRDSVAVMTTYGVNTLISDSGVIKYRIVTEEWEVNQNKKPSRWTFNKGILLTQFDLKKHVVGYIQSDTAVYYDELQRWELRGRVRVLTANGLVFRSNQLTWDEREHQIWSHAYSYLKTPDKEMRGTWFKSDEQMMDYEIRNPKGWSVFSEPKDDGEARTPTPAFAPIDTLHRDNFKGPVYNK